MSETVIRATGLTKRFGNLEILKGISLEVHRGEIVAIVGASGAGKTTLLQILGTLDRPDRGSVEIAGQDVLRLSPDAVADFRNKRIGFVFQFHQLLPEFTAQENVAIPAMISGLKSRDAMTRAGDILEKLGLKERLKHRPNQLSGGEKQRVAVARALVNRPDIIFADEPTGALDSANKLELHHIFDTLRRELGQTFVVVTHDDTISAISDRIIRLSDGRIISEERHETNEER